MSDLPDVTRFTSSEICPPCWRAAAFSEYGRNPPCFEAIAPRLKADEISYALGQPNN
jgi:pyrimidine deaminase RibD-like protein